MIPSKEFMIFSKKSLKSIILSLLIITLSPQKALAVCPACTVAVGVGVGLSRWFGIDDTIAGIWLGGLIASLSMWTITWLNRKGIRFFGRKIIVVLSYYLLIVVPLYFSDVIGHPLNKLWGVDKILLGIILGSVAFSIGSLGYFKLKKKNNEHAYFPFQKIVMPIAGLIILSLVFCLITK